MEVTKTNKIKIIRAKKRVKEIKGFYVHLMIYLIINTSLIVIKIVGTTIYGETFMGPFWHFSTLANWLFWGIGLTFHALKVFRVISFFGSDWEERQIQKFIAQDKKEAEKYS